MECIELFEYLPEYGLNVFLDNFVINTNTILFNLDIDLKQKINNFFIFFNNFFIKFFYIIYY